jgi:hypothetical protein
MDHVLYVYIRSSLLRCALLALTLFLLSYMVYSCSFPILYFYLSGSMHQRCTHDVFFAYCGLDQLNAQPRFACRFYPNLFVTICEFSQGGGKQVQLTYLTQLQLRRPQRRRRPKLRPNNRQ